MFLAELIRIFSEAAHETLEVLGGRFDPALRSKSTADHLGVVVRDFEAFGRASARLSLLDHLDKFLPLLFGHKSILTLSRLSLGFHFRLG